jgi:hypothetical protein
MKKLLVPATVAFLAGCVSIPTVQNFGNGRFLHMTVGDVVILQTDTVSPEVCNEEAAKLQRTPNQKAVCSTTSQEKSLPFSFATENVITGVSATARFKSLEICNLLKVAMQKEPNSSVFKYSECKSNQ